MNSNKAAFIGFLLVLPFVVLNFIVVFRIEPIYSFLGSINVLTSSPWTPTLLLFLFPVAFFVVIQPMLRKGPDGKHNFYVLNAVFAALILVATIFLWSGLSADIIACDVLHIPNCD